MSARLGMSARLVGLVAAASLQLVALVLAHELVFLARHGSRYGEALVHAGHGETWGGAVATSVLLAALLGLIALGRLAHLARQARGSSRAPSTRAGTLEPRLLGRIWLHTGVRLAVVGVILLTVQENFERASTGAPVPGASILLTPEYAGGLWIAIAVGLAVGLVAAIYEWRRGLLLAKLRASRPRPLRSRATRGFRRLDKRAHVRRPAQRRGDHVRLATGGVVRPGRRAFGGRPRDVVAMTRGWDAARHATLRERGSPLDSRGHADR